MAHSLHETRNSSKLRKGPCGEALRQLLDEQGDTLTVTRSVVGSRVAERVIEGALRVRLRDVGRAERRERGGRVVHVPRTARADLSQRPVREANSKVVRRLCETLVRIAGWIDAKQNVTRGAARVSVGAVARLVNISEREAQRYLAFFRSVGVLRAWQPPQTSAAPKGGNGFCYELYSFVEGVPETLKGLLQRYNAQQGPKPRPAAVAAPAQAERAPATPVATSGPPGLSEGASALAAALLNRFALPG